MATKAERTANGTPVLETAEEVLHVERNVQAFFEGPPFRSEGKGDLFVTSRRVVWLHSTNAAHGFGITFQSLSIHAICTDTDSFPHPCIYCQVDKDDDGLSEVRFVPDRVEAVTGMYTAFSAGAELNPDPPGSDDEGQGDFFFDEEEVKANLRIPGIVESLSAVAMDDSTANGRFADAEESEDEGDEDEEMVQDGA
jgi:nucleotide-sensitive chloride channel 1A